MKYYCTVFFLLLPFLCFSQIRFQLDGVVNKKIPFNDNLKEGSKVKLVSIDKVPNYTYLKATVIFNEKYDSFDIGYIDKVSFTPTNIKDFWQIQSLKSGVFNNIVKNGLQYTLRKELEEESQDFINYTESNNMLFKDSYLESYLYALIHKIYPTRLEDGRLGILNVRILKDTEPNAFIFANGTMFISTGLLSTINSEEELIGIVAHEIAHFVLDHSLININAAQQRKNRSEFWSAFVTGIAAAADIYASVKNEYYTAGSITMATAILSYSFASKLTERMGMKYSREQENEADKCAADLMKFINVDHTALSAALLKIRNYNILNGNNFAISGEGTHPAIIDRVNNIGKPIKTFEDAAYDKTISFVNTYNAVIEMYFNRFESCSILVTRNINAGVAIEDDYLLLAMSTIFMSNDVKSNNLALSYILKAKELNVYPSINIHKQESIVLIRLKRLFDAKAALNKYISSLDIEKTKLSNVMNEREWSYLNKYINNEKEWATKMIYKIDKM
jgi:Zn-dependent protease with chaperone function